MSLTERMERNQISRPFEAGKHMAESIIEMVHLMYQNNTASNFYKGLMKELNQEIKRRNIKL